MFDLDDLDLDEFDEQLRQHDKRVARVRAVQELAVRGVTPEERANAKNMVAHLMKAYGITPDAIAMLLAVFVVFF